MIKPEQKKQDDLHKQYSEATQALRHYSGLRFAILTVFFAYVGGLVTLLSNQTLFIVLSAKIGGLIGVLVFWIFELRLAGYIDHYEKRIFELEKDLHYKIYTGRDVKILGVKFISVRNTTWLMYFAIFVFWVVSFYM